jgi:RNase P subunit RPR2
MSDRRGRRGRRTHNMVSVAKERIDILFASAQERALKGRADLANRYVSLAFVMAQRYNVRLTRAQKASFCRNCGSYLLTSASARVRIREGRVIRQCLGCKDIRRIPLKKKQVTARVKSPSPGPGHMPGPTSR